MELVPGPAIFVAPSASACSFVVFIELVGTLVLPAAITFTFYLIIISIVRKPVPVIPLVLLALILGLPAVLIVLTAHRWSYVLWMFDLPHLAADLELCASSLRVLEIRRF